MSLDRIDNAKGYVPRNVRVISYRANHLKHNATDDELIALGKDAQYRKSLIQHFMVKLLMGDAADQGATANAD